MARQLLILMWAGIVGVGALLSLYVADTRGLVDAFLPMALVLVLAMTLPIYVERTK